MTKIDFFTENRLLQTLYNQPQFIEHSHVNETLFSSAPSRNVYKALFTLKENGTPFTKDALLQQYGLFDLDASTTIIDNITQKQTEELKSIDDIIIQLKDATKRRKASANLKEAVRRIEDSTKVTEDLVNDVKDLVGNGESELSLDNYSTKRIMGFEEWTEQYNKDLNNRRKGKQYYFYNFIFDELIHIGPQPGEIGIICSSSGSGKSTLATNLVNSLINVEIPCMYFSLEMSSITTMDRLLAKRLELQFSEIVSPDLDKVDDTISYINEELNRLKENKKFRFSEDPSMSLNDLRKYIKKFQSEVGQRYCIVVLDLLSMVTDFAKVYSGLNFAQGIELSMNKLSAISKELGVHVIGILQLNRSQETDVKVHDVKDLQKFKPNRAQIKNAGAFLERSRYIISTFREKMYAELYLEPDQYDNMLDIIECSVVKFNNGKIGKTVRGLFNGEYFSIDPLSNFITI